MDSLESVRKILQPIPRQLTQGEGAPLVLERGKRFCFSAPEAAFGPAMSAREKMSAFLRDKCAEDCICDAGIPVTLSLAQAPQDIPNADEGYRLSVSAEGVKLTGFGEKGLLYGTYTFIQICETLNGAVPALEILDWPDAKIRGIKQESRYGSNMMERQDWMDMLEDLARRKMNFLGLAMYGCWTVQYSGKQAEFLYLPVKGHPELQTPMEVRYFSVEENRWIDCQQLPPIFRDNLMEDIFRKARDLGIQVCPSWNSYGHNTLIPRMIPAVSAKEADGVTPTEFGFCTESEQTYELLFSIYDQIIDDYMKPYGMDCFATLLDEVRPGIGQNAKRPFDKISPFCQCEKCRDKDHGQMFIDMVIKTTQYLKQREVKSVILANDMLKHEHSIPGLTQRLQKALEEADLLDVLLLDWWSYSDVEKKMKFHSLDTDGMRNIAVPWTGYHNWSALYHPLENIRMLAEMNHRDGGEGLFGYSSWDRSCDRNYDALSDYAWNFAESGTTEQVTDRYVRRHFGAQYQKARRAYSLMDLCTEERIMSLEDADKRIISHFELMLYKLSYYNYTYVKANQPHPRNYPGEAVQWLLSMRKDTQRELTVISAMAKEANMILRELAQDGCCDQKQAMRMACECVNYENIAEDFLTLLQMHDLTVTGDYESIAQLARQRQKARLDQLALCEQFKDRYVAKALSMRNISVNMQFFCDIADYIENTQNPELDMTDLQSVMSERSVRLR